MKIFIQHNDQNNDSFSIYFGDQFYFGS